MRIGIPITLGASVMSLMTIIDTKLVLLRLKTAAGFCPAAVLAFHSRKFMPGTLSFAGRGGIIF